MIAVVAVTLAVALAGALSLIAWLTYRTVTSASKEADQRVGQNETENLLEREQFEHEKAKQALDRSRKRAAALEEALFHEIDRPFPDADLDPGDHRTRVRRLAEAWRAAEDGDPLPAEPAGTVPVHETPAAAPATSTVPGNELLPFDDVP